MAVIKSSSLGQVRKSIGATNYYRRAGVQLARSKPTFAPGRTFTPAQLNQQFRMQTAQYILLTIGLGKCSNCTNVVNNRLYNASSRYNRMVKGIMNCSWADIEGGQSTPEQLYAEGYDVLLEKWSIGDVKGGPSLIRASGTGTSVSLTFSGLNNVIAELIRLANKRRRPSGYLNERNIGVCGIMINGSGVSMKNLVVLPTFNNDDRPVPDENLRITVDVSSQIDYTKTLEGSFVFFIGDNTQQGAESVDIIALHCTNNSVLTNIQKP